MAEREEYWYLDPEIDGSKITVPELRSILLKHGVTYPSSAKKPALLALFEENVLPQAAKLQRAQARTKRSSRGIEDVPSSAASTTTDEAEDETLLAPPPPSARRTSRRTRAVSEEEPIRTTRSSRTPLRTVPTKHARGSDAEVEEQPAVRRNRKSATPAVKREPVESVIGRRQDEDSPFTQDNPFQSGSSPVPDTAARERRRRTLGTDQKERRRSDAYRRKTYQPKVEQLDQGIVVPTRRTFDVPVSRMPKQEPVEESDGVEAGEEFTPEEQLELVRERARAGEVDILPPRRRKQRAKATGTLKAFSLTLLGTAAALLGGVWRQEKLAVGFCGIGRESTSLAGVEVPEWASDIIPQCEPCPPHATCYQNLELVCDKDFVKKDHPLSLGGLIPLPATCEPDTEKTRRIGVVANRAVQLLRERNAKYECGETDAEGNLVESPQISEGDLKKELSSMKRKGMSQEEFDDLFESAIGEVVRRDETIESSDGNSNGRRLASNSLANLPLGCSIKRSLRHALERYLWQLAVIIVILTSGAYGRYSITSNRAMETRAKQLAGDVFDRLANQAALHRGDPGRYPEQGMSMTHLRDDVLRNEFSSARRHQLWARVQKKVEHNSNIRAAVRETHSGDVARMWEWVGPVQLLEDGRGSERRESGRYSYGTAIASSPPDNSSIAYIIFSRASHKRTHLNLTTGTATKSTSRPPFALSNPHSEISHNGKCKSSYGCGNQFSACDMDERGPTATTNEFDTTAFCNDTILRPNKTINWRTMANSVKIWCMGLWHGGYRTGMYGDGRTNGSRITRCLDDGGTVMTDRKTTTSKHALLTGDAVPLIRPLRLWRDSAQEQVNVPKTRRTYCKGKDCKKHTQHKVTQYKAGKASLFAQGKRRYDRKQSGYGGQTKPVFHKRAKTTKKVVLRLECTQCKSFLADRAGHSESFTHTDGEARIAGKRKRMPVTIMGCTLHMHQMELG
ncbi:uncharacterized protein EI97DRAFT_504421 [Westerdykella ornata]|uniref:Sister chromatid separation protein-like protein n=1 Tax=Westerdykella ornata TaxID=318751 RepID=A0A6A6JAG6_WESOR|nr:uncharacterized protein EI97DRAFT_504421 [Westerdykella ornata]KAF2272189.1 hypothetical protein EI97DRAFT_504421 [Westerdykella ornata]